MRRFSLYPFGSEGKGLERETLCPFPRLRRFGTHIETGSKFLLLFSIKSKEEILCFAAKVPNERTPHVCQAIFLRFCALFFSRTCAVPLIKKPPYLSVWRFFLSEIPIPYLSLSCAPSSSAKPFKILSIASAISASANVFSALRKVMEYATDL